MIKINDKYFINADPSCYVLVEKTTIADENSKNLGEEVNNNIGYYSTLESLLKGLFTKEIRSYISKSEDKDLKELKEEIIKTKNFIEGLNLKI